MSDQCLLVQRVEQRYAVSDDASDPDEAGQAHDADVPPSAQE